MCTKIDNLQLKCHCIFADRANSGKEITDACFVGACIEIETRGTNALVVGL